MLNPPALDVRSHTLDNGLTVHVAPMPHTHTSAFALLVRVGSRHEAPERHGVSHLLEHMLYRGTVRLRGPREVNAAFERLGAPSSAATHRDHTLFEMRTLPETIEPAMVLLGELLREPTFGDLDVERRIVLEERLDAVDERGRSSDVEDLAMAAMFPDDALGRTIIGSRRSIRRLDVADLRAHQSAFYTARNMVLAVAGPIDPAPILLAAQAAFGWLPPGSRVTAPRATARTDLPAVAVNRQPGAQTDFDLSLLAPPEGHRDFLAAEMLLRVLDDGEASRLRARLCDDLGLAYDVGARLEGYAEAGLLRIDGAASHKQIDRMIVEILQVLRELRERVPDADEVERARVRLRLELLGLMAAPESVAWRHADSSLHRDPELPDRLVARAMAITPDDVRAIARKILRAENAQLTLVGELPSKVLAALKESVSAL